MTTRAPVHRVLALACGAGFLVLTALVWTGQTQQLDIGAREHFRPADVWGDAQLRADWVVEGLRPRLTFPALALAACLTCALRRSWRPMVFAGILAASSGIATLAVKVLLARPDPHLDLSTFGGSYPSGHLVGVWACVGGVVLLWSDRSRWWQFVPAVVASSLMGWCLLLQGAHWLTDVLGGSLLEVSLLAALSGLGVRHRAEPAPAPRTGG